MGFMNMYKKEVKFVFILIGISPSVIMCLINIQHSHYPIWASRRMIYNILPLCIIGFIYFINDIKTKYYKIIAFITILFIIVSNYSFIFNNNSYYIGLTNSLDNFSESFNEDDVVLIDGNMQYSIGIQQALEYYYDIESISVYPTSITDQELIKLNSRKSVVYITEENSEFGERLKKLFTLISEKEILVWDDIENHITLKQSIPFMKYRTLDN